MTRHKNRFAGVSDYRLETLAKKMPLDDMSMDDLINRAFIAELISYQQKAIHMQEVLIDVVNDYKTLAANYAELATGKKPERIFEQDCPPSIQRAGYAIRALAVFRTSKRRSRY